ncbi:quinone oxidoreductase [Galendromus occidentalis]|uniref:Quinone oxidoreductase n=1 Tax=Galendromus occidentalis TaxID=34638 RepID=A0AAJ6QSY2_9ACAR|nr:quinone oxidoreductase [Galendromus occidentalis]
MMRGILVKALGDPHVMKMAEIPIPKISPNEVLVRVDYAGVNPVDTYVRAGTFGRSPPLPYTPGKDGAGTVERVGAKVRHVAPGDKVFFCSMFSDGGHGSYAELAVAEENEVWPLPGGDSSLGAALGTPYLTAYRALITKGRCTKGETVLVHGGSGAVGQACVQIAKNEGLRVIATAGSAEGLDILRELGADLVLDHKLSDDRKIAELKERAPSGLDIIVEMRADLNLGTDCQVIGKKGRILVVGNRGSTTLDARFLMFPEASISGVAILAATKDEFRDASKYVSDGVREGWARPNISKIYSLESAPQAHIDIIESRGGATGKLLLDVAASLKNG